ncbi:MAG: sulfurtransferase TusA family protein [Alicyclobacillus macrosporangiidus]|uniref:sulfurtransferase TusA family protein n=1 Tax=Alicyclobacillus macrosporangiidus TaxID=392015 RepID=UPI0026ECB3E7|nr:sulfurtransferase TusA family protein [Alicyclobacillus macrosporangiidus]MCL6599787.1 sulfurtransferase TusA family protein [Alicyclobacillus macrosporangiidus]
MTEIRVDKTIDCKGLSCPMPIVRTKKAIDEMEAGQVLEVVATDPGSVADVKGWAHRTGHQFLGTITEGKVFRHFIRKSRPEETKPEQRFPHTVTNEELTERLADGVVLIDVREPAEYVFSHIPGAISVPLGELEQRLAELASYVHQPVYVICRTGHRSDVACQVLSEQGFERVYNVVPGMSQWQGPTEQSV